MKKTLIALAVLAASSASMAQVTLYGVADVAVGAVDNSKGGLGLTNDKTQLIGNGSLTNGNSRFGLKGTEDLGGGLKAMFNYESSIQILNGANAGSGDMLFSRQAWVGLSGGFGTLTVGRQFTPSFDVGGAAWELTGYANYSDVGNQFSFNGTGPRDDASIKYKTPALGGFAFAGSFVPEGNGVYQDAAKANKSKYDLVAAYGAGPLAVSLAYNKVDAGQEGTLFGGSYDFGMVKLAASYQSTKDGSGNKLIEGYSLGASLPVGQWTFTADAAVAQSGSKLLAGQSSDTDFLLEAKYALSKRTTVYGVYLRDGKGQKTEDVNGYSIGLRHNF